MHDDATHVRNRVRRFVAERIGPAAHRASVPLTVTAFQTPGEPVPFAQAVAGRFEPFAIGTAWGRPWGTVWFRATGTVFSPICCWSAHSSRSSWAVS